MTEESPSTPEASDKREQIDAILHEFRAAQDGRPRLDGTIPRRLHHYTTLDGLIGIVSSDVLWASDARFLNDSSELSYAAGLIDEVIAEMTAEVTSDALQSVLPQRPGVANAFEYGSRPFVTCFCEDDDLLSQWRGYDAGATGFSLGLDLHQQSTFHALPTHTYLRKVVYEEVRQRDAVREVVATWLQTAELLLGSERGLIPTDVFPYPAIWALQDALAEHHLCFKHPAFAEEREWRLIKLVDVREELRLLNDRRREQMLGATRKRMLDLGVDMPESGTAWSQANAEGIEIKFRRSSFGLVPYIELSLKDRAGISRTGYLCGRSHKAPRRTPSCRLSRCTCTSIPRASDFTPR